jgi:Uma2 family endonuclease
MSSQPKTFLTPEEYLEIERKAEFKSEFHAGGMFAMAGGRAAHNALIFNLGGAIGQQIRNGARRGYNSGMRVRVSATGLYTYPDLAVVCGIPQFIDDRQDTLLNPTFIAEVLSPSTEAYDRGRKFEHYRSLDSLQEYLLVSSERVQLDLYTRQPSGQWLFTAANRLDDSLELRSVGCKLALADLYENVDLAG